MEQERENASSALSGPGFSWAVRVQPASLSQSALVHETPVLYQQSSISSLLFVTNPQDFRGHNGSRQFKKNLLSVPTQLLMPDGGIALGMPPSSLVAGTAGGGAGGRVEGGNTEESRMSALRGSELAVFLSESPESQIRSRRSRLLLLLAILLSLQYISVFAILQEPVMKTRKSRFTFAVFGGAVATCAVATLGDFLRCLTGLDAQVVRLQRWLHFERRSSRVAFGKDAPSIFLPGSLVKQVTWRNVVYHAQLVLLEPARHSALRHNFYIVALCLCLLLPLLLFVAVVEQKRQMESIQTPDARRHGCRSLVPSTVLSLAVVVFTSLTLTHSIFIVRTYFDIMVFFLFFAIRYTLNRLNYTCFSPHLLLTKAGNNL